MSEEIKISGAVDFVDPLGGVADALVSLMKEPTPEWSEGRVRIAKCPHCRRRPEFRREGPDVLVRSGVEGVEALAIHRYVILPCCSATYAKNEDGSLRMNEGLSLRQVLRIREQMEKNQR